LVKDPNGAYSQLIRLQETRADERRKTADSGSGVPDHSRSKSTSLSQSLARRSLLNKDSFGSSSSNRYSFKNPLGLAVDLHEDRSTIGGEKTEELSDVVVVPKKAPIGRLLKLNMPEVPVLLLGSVAASVHGVVFPLFGLLMSGIIKSFFEPPDKLREDSSFWALIAVALGVTCLVVVPAQYFLFAVAGGKLIERIRALSFQSIVRQEISWFDNASNSR
jgi:ATP-binding cassette, subfamily B (MDR/TAP), member 1